MNLSQSAPAYKHASFNEAVGCSSNICKARGRAVFENSGKTLWGCADRTVRFKHAWCCLLRSSKWAEQSVSWRKVNRLRRRLGQPGVSMLQEEGRWGVGVGELQKFQASEKPVTLGTRHGRVAPAESCLHVQHAVRVRKVGQQGKQPATQQNVVRISSFSDKKLLPILFSKI